MSEVSYSYYSVDMNCAMFLALKEAWETGVLKYRPVDEKEIKRQLFDKINDDVLSSAKNRVKAVTLRLWKQTVLIRDGYIIIRDE